MPIVLIILFSIITIALSIYSIVSRILIFCKDNEAEEKFEKQMQDVFNENQTTEQDN